MSVQCKACVKAITVANDRVICFGGCGQVVHAKCSDLTSAGVMALRENVSIRYVCNDCRKLQTCSNSVMNKCEEMLKKLDDSMKHMEFMFAESEDKIVAKLVEKTEQRWQNVIEEFIRKNNKDLKISEKKIVDSLTCEIQKNVKNLEKNVEKNNVTKEGNGSKRSESNTRNFAEVVGGNQSGGSEFVLRSGRVIQKPEIVITSAGELPIVNEVPSEETDSVLPSAKHNNVLNKKSPKKSNMANTVRIKPKVLQTNQDTKKEVRSKIDQTLSGIKSVRNAKNGAILVECKSINEADLLMTQANDKIGENYEIFIEQPKKPKIKILGMEKEYEDEALKEIMVEQNDLSEIKHFKIVKMNKTSGQKFNTVSAICEIDSETFQKIMRWGKLNIEWEVCKVVEHVDILRCFKCCAYGHRSNDCSSTKICVRCAGDHDVKECSSENVKCINCVKLNSERKLNINVDHAAWSTDCPVYKRNVKVSKQFIDYGK